MVINILQTTEEIKEMIPLTFDIFKSIMNTKSKTLYFLLRIILS